MANGRRFPWGSRMDSSLCQNRHARDEPPQPEPIGSFPTAVSVYGMGDAAGNVYDWTSSLREPDIPGSKQRLFRGGSWGAPVDNARCGIYYGDLPDFRGGFLSFRPARSLT